MEDNFKDKRQKKHADLSGESFGEWLVLKRVEDRISPNGAKLQQYLCICSCGTKKIVLGCNLKSGKSTSCNKGHTRVKNNELHTFVQSRLYNIHQSMKERCCNKAASNYKNYGGRGITVCNEWLGETGGMNFYKWALENGYEDEKSLDRIDNNGNYTPENCKWSTPLEQKANKRNNRVISYKGETYTLSQWGRILNKNPDTISERLRRGWSVEQALFKSVKH